MKNNEILSIDEFLRSGDNFAGLIVKLDIYKEASKPFGDDVLDELKEKYPGIIDRIKSHRSFIVDSFMSNFNSKELKIASNCPKYNSDLYNAYKFIQERVRDNKALLIVDF